MYVSCTQEWYGLSFNPRFPHQFIFKMLDKTGIELFKRILLTHLRFPSPSAYLSTYKTTDIKQVPRTAIHLKCLFD